MASDVRLMEHGRRVEMGLSQTGPRKNWRLVCAMKGEAKFQKEAAVIQTNLSSSLVRIRRFRIFRVVIKYTKHLGCKKFV